jgi:hypothetical protein
MRLRLCVRVFLFACRKPETNKAAAAEASTIDMHMQHATETEHGPLSTILTDTAP